MMFLQNNSSSQQVSLQQQQVSLSSTNILRLFDGDFEASNNEDKANLLNIIFYSQSSLDDPDHPLPNIPVTDTCFLSKINISRPKLKRCYITVMDSLEASGPDLVHPGLISQNTDILPAPPSSHCNKLLRNTDFPSSWKLANVTPVYKNLSGIFPQPLCNAGQCLSCLGRIDGTPCS